MRRRAERICDYRTFSDPYAGLAAMIFVQADCDLKILDGSDIKYKGGTWFERSEIISFLRSPWAAFLAYGLGVNRTELENYTARVAG